MTSSWSFILQVCYLLRATLAMATIRRGILLIYCSSLYSISQLKAYFEINILIFNFYDSYMFRTQGFILRKAVAYTLNGTVYFTCIGLSILVGRRVCLIVSVLQAEAQVFLQPATRTPLKPNHTKSLTHNEPRTKRPMW